MAVIEISAAKEANKRNEKGPIASMRPFKFCLAANASGRKRGSGLAESALEVAAPMIYITACEAANGHPTLRNRETDEKCLKK